MCLIGYNMENFLNIKANKTMQRFIYFVRNICDYIPNRTIREQGLINKIRSNCMLIYLPHYNSVLAEQEITSLWHDTFYMAYYKVPYGSNVDDKWNRTPHENKFMKTRMEQVFIDNGNCELDPQQWLKIFQSKVKTLYDSMSYVNLMNAHWAYKHYINSLESVSKCDKLTKINLRI